MMKNVRSALVLTLALALGATSLACSGQAENTQPQTTASALTKAPIGTNTHGVVRMVGEALGEVALRPDQRTELEKLAQEADKRHLAMVDGRKELMLAVADQVEKGSIDRAALQPKIDRVTSDFEKSRPDDHAAMARVHALLDPDQRNAFVDALEAKLKAKRGEHHEGFAQLKQLGDDLKLTDDQRSQIRETMHKSIKEHLAQGGEAREDGPRPSFRDHSKAFHEGKKTLESFRTDKFDATALGPPDLKDKMEKGTTHIVGVAEKVLPILTSEQRKIAADKLRAMAEKGEMGPFGGH